MRKILTLLLLTLATTADAAVTIFNITGTGGTNATSSIFWSGETTDSVVSSRNARQLTGRNAEVTFTVTGTAATLQGYVTSVDQPVAVSVDGGAFTLVPTMTDATWTTLTLFTGLSDAAHTVIVRDQGASFGNSFYVDRDSVVTVTGAVPAIAAPTGYGSMYKLSASGVNSYIVPEGGGAFSSAQGNNTYTTSRTDLSFHFKATISTLSCWGYRSGTKVALWIDGVRQTMVTLPSVSTWGRVDLYSGLDSAAEHDYVLQIGTPSPLIYDLVTTGGTGINTTTLAARPVFAGYGDSITSGSSGSDGSSTASSWLFKLAMRMGYQVNNRGIGSTSVRNYGAGGTNCTTFSGESRTADVTGISPDPAAVFILYGVNDAAGGCSGGTPPTTANFKTSYRAMVDAMVAGVGAGTEIYVIPIRYYNSGSGVDVTSAIFNTAIAEVVTEVAQPNVILLNPDTEFSTLHPGDVETTTFSNDLFSELDTDSSGGLLLLGVE
jgi:lysophospholipase L1-like esterase